MRILLNLFFLLIPGFTVIAQTELPGVHLPAYQEGQYVHTAPDINQLKNNPDIHPKLKATILKGYDLFNNTQQLRGKYIFNDLNCGACHMGAGAKNWSSPVWAAATTLPDYRGKNDRINTLEDRIGGCFMYSMNGIQPTADSPEMVALAAYHRWLATGAPVYEYNIGGRGFNHLGKQPPTDLDYQKGQKVFVQECAICHGNDGAGQQVDGEIVFPPLWGDNSYNWGAGIVRIFTAASYIQNNMPFGKPGSLSAEDAWQVANFINSHERPQDPRYTGDVKETREMYLNFHKFSNYGLEINDQLMGNHNNTGERPKTTESKTK